MWPMFLKNPEEINLLNQSKHQIFVVKGEMLLIGITIRTCLNMNNENYKCTNTKIVVTSLSVLAFGLTCVEAHDSLISNPTTYLL